ncbi:MAG: phage terminase small subunit [Victivallaceae bacterium]|nr:phage terminase small subunit [Victivallaceae bacterium]
MISPAWQHRERVRQQLAASAAKAAAEKAEKQEISKMAADKERFELLLVQLDVDCKRLSELPQGSAREPLKRELVKSYLPLVEAYITGKQEYRNIVLTQVMVWLFDLGEIDQALKLAAVAVAQNQPMPARYSRDVRTFIADAVLEWCKKQSAAGDPIEPYFLAMHEQVMQWQVHDVIKVKYLTLAAREHQAAGDVEKALTLCLDAEKLDPQAKIKTLKKELEKAVAEKREAAAHAQAKPAADAGPGQDGSET